MRTIIAGGGIGVHSALRSCLYPDEARAPDDFDDLDAVASYAEREAIVRSYASLAGYARSQVDRRAG